MRNRVLSAMLLCSLATACSSDPATPVDREPARSESTLAPAVFDSVSPLIAERGAMTALGDAPAELAFRRVETLMAAKSAAELAIYQLVPPEDPMARMARRSMALGLANEVKVADEDGPSGMVRARGDAVRLLGGFQGRAWALEYNRRSGSERLFDVERFHAGNGAIAAPDPSAFAGAALRFSESVREAVPTRLHVYKVRSYKNAEDADGVPVSEEVYQVAVAFGTDVGGVPVIGPGGKVSVHLANGMEPVSYESSVVALAGERGRTRVSGMLAPAEAERTVWARVAADGIGPTTHVITSRQFGYYRRGRGSHQRLMAPTYAFFFTPTVEFAKKRVETIDATTDPALLADLRADANEEAARKRRAVEPDAR